MRWIKRGIVWAPDGRADWARTHGMGPTPYLLNHDVIRIFVTCLDEQGRGRPGFVDVSAADPKRVLGQSRGPVLDIGLPGSFDDNGLAVLSVIEGAPGILYMYYAGFELCNHIRYRIFTGLAKSRDGGTTFERYSRAPILDRSTDELYFRCGPFVLRDAGTFKLWYIAGSEWTDIGGKSMPVYDLRYLESDDGIHWGPSGTVSMAITGDDEHGFGRPWIVKRGPLDYRMYYSIRRRSLSAYRLGYAESEDGIRWVRKDDQMGLGVSPDAFDSDAIMYSAVITVHGRTYCFYNGNQFGLDGFGVAELAEA